MKITFVDDFLTEKSIKKLKKLYSRLRDKDKKKAELTKQKESLENGYYNSNNEYITEP